jgi:hypothetical protein
MGIVLFWKGNLAIFAIALIVGLFPKGPLYADDLPQTNLDLIPITGTLLERGTKTPLRDVSITVLPHRIRIQSDSQGQFEVRVPQGAFQWVINLAGYERLDQEDRIGFDQPQKLQKRELFLEKSSYQVYETTIYGKAGKRDGSIQTLNKAEFLQVPGARGDPIKAVENLPGVARNNTFQSQVIIQGSAPNDTRYSIDGNEVPIIFHFGGLSSVLTPESIESVDYLAAGYGPEFGRALGGQIAVKTRDPSQEKMKGFAFVDTFNAGGLIESPLSSSSSILVSGRHSYVGALLKGFLKDNSQLQLTAVPEFKDLTLIINSEVTPRDQFKVVAVGSEDTFEFLFTQPLKTDPSVRGAFKSQTSFYRLIPQLTHKHSSITTSHVMFGLGRDFINVEAGSSFFDLRTHSLGTRYELDRKMSQLWRSYWGMDHQFSWAEVDLNLPRLVNPGGVINPISVSSTRQARVDSSFSNLGLFWRNTFNHETSPWTFSPNLRVEYYSSTRELLPTPRGEVKVQLTDSLSLRTAGGLYVQPPQPQEIDSSVGNPDLKANQGIHLSFGVDKDFRGGSSNGFDLSLSPFYKHLSNLVIPTSRFITRNGVLTPQNYTNEQTGRVIGIQTQLKYQFSRWNGWLSYTLSRSTRSDQNATDYLFQYDQTHILTALASVRLPSNWSFSTRFRYSTGNVITPIVSGLFDTDNDTYIPVRGPFFSQRLEPFYQLDIRVDKKWIYDRWILSLYLDVQNATNQRNVQQIQYSYNYSSRVNVTGLPVIPTFGLKAEF